MAKISTRTASWIVAAAIGIMLLGTRLHGYLLFHSFAEILSATVAFAVFIIAWNTSERVSNGFFIIFASGSLFTGLLDILHALAYRGMGIFPPDANLPTQLWVGARLLQAATLIAAPLLASRKLPARETACTFLTAAAILIVAVFGGWFPDCFVDGSGLTPFKKGAEYAICAAFALSLLLMERVRSDFAPSSYRLLVISTCTFIASELTFTLYVDVYGIMNMTGHVLKLAGYFLVYKAVVEAALLDPFDVLFRELKQSEERYRERTHQLEAVNHDLEAFTYTVSHDIRSPLTAIRGFTDLLLESFEQLPETDRRMMLDAVSRQARRIEDLSNDLLRFSRLAGQDVKGETFDLSRLATEVSCDMMARSPERQVRFVAPPRIDAYGDRGLIRIAMENLLGNAWKYTLDVAEPVIELGMETRPDGRPIYFVRDNGIGFDPTHAKEIFKPFTRACTDPRHQGTGIGLATVHRIIGRHGGNVWATAEKGRGASFYFTLFEDSGPVSGGNFL